MSQAGFSYKGLDEVERHLRLLDGEAAYLIFQDRTDPRGDETLGRFELTMEAAAPWLSLMGESHNASLPFRRLLGVNSSGSKASPPARDNDPDDELDDDDESDEDADEREGRGGGDLPTILKVACWWVREMATRNSVGESYRRFRVRVYGPKGVKSLYCGQFVCSNPEVVRPPEPVRSVPPPMASPAPAALPAIPALPTITPAEQEGVSTGMVALGNYYAQFGHLLLGSVTHLQGLSDGIMTRMDVHLRESREQVDQLVASFLEFRFKQVSEAEESNAATRQQETNSTLARNAITGLSDVAKAFVVTRGMPPETTELISALGTSPELMTTLKDPDVQAMMKDPSNLRDLAGLLKQAGQQARAMKGAPAEMSKAEAPPTQAAPTAPVWSEPTMAQATVAAPSMPYQGPPQGNWPNHVPADPAPFPQPEAGASSAWPGAPMYPMAHPYSTPILVPIGHPSLASGASPGHGPAPHAGTRDVPWPPGSSRPPSASPGTGTPPRPSGQGSPPSAPPRT